MDNVRNTTDVEMIHIRRLRWGAIFAGALIMIVTMMLLSLLGLGIGLGTIKPMEEQNPVQGLGTGAIIYWVIANLIAVFAGGYVAGKLMSANFKGSGIYHGLLAWSVYAIVSFFILTTTVGAIFNGVGTVVSKSVSGIGSGINSLMAGADGNLNIQDILNKLGANQDDVNKVKDQMTNVLKQVFIKDGKLNTDVSRQDIEKAISENTQLKPEQVQQVSDEIDKGYQQAKVKLADLKVKAKETSEKVASATSKAAIWGFIALLIGAILSAIGGKIGESTDETVNVKR